MVDGPTKKNIHDLDKMKEIQCEKDRRKYKRYISWKKIERGELKFKRGLRGECLCERERERDCACVKKRERQRVWDISVHLSWSNKAGYGTYKLDLHPDSGVDNLTRFWGMMENDNFLNWGKIKFTFQNTQNKKFWQREDKVPGVGKIHKINWLLAKGEKPLCVLFSLWVLLKLVLYVNTVNSVITNSLGPAEFVCYNRGLL